MRKDCIIITHVDDCLIFYEEKKVLGDFIPSLKDEFRLTNEGNFETFLDVNFIQKDSNAQEFNQLHLTQSTLKFLGLNNDTKVHDAPDNSMLHKDCHHKKRC